MDNNETKQLQIDINPEIAKGSYSNLAIITHSPSEFVIDFASFLPGMPKPQVGSRIIMDPTHAKTLLGALIENIGKYEAQFGPIGSEREPKATFNINDFTGMGGSKS